MTLLPHLDIEKFLMALPAAWQGASLVQLRQAPEGSVGLWSTWVPSRCWGSSHCQEAALASLLGSPRLLCVCFRYTYATE